jgi:hypothetical protein
MGMGPGGCTALGWLVREIEAPNSERQVIKGQDNERLLINGKGN